MQYFEKEQMVHTYRNRNRWYLAVRFSLLRPGACHCMLYTALWHAKGSFKNALNNQWLFQDLSGLLLGRDEEV